jgi:hypothetical protein
MYRAFNLEPFHFKTSPFANSQLETKGLALSAENSRLVRTALNTFLIDGKLDGTEMTAHWFPEIKADVFVSHSHKDRRLALMFAGWLSTIFHVTPFVDSDVWGNSADLLKEIDDALCLSPGGNSYSYEKRNESTSHVHMMLATALAKVIDNTECVIFISTPNSITPAEAVEKTCSPWIFYELAMVGQTRRRPASDHRPLIKQATFAEKEAMEEVLIQYQVDLSLLTTIDADALNAWKRQFEETIPNFALDTLYEIAPE